MIRIRVSKGWGAMDLALNDLQKRVLPYATAAALTDAAKAGKAAVVKAMPSTFDRPTPFTANSLVVIAANKRNLTAIVKIKDLQAKYLLLEETGGARTPDMTTKGSGKALSVPGKGLKLDRYGNIPPGFLKRVFNEDVSIAGLTPVQAKRKQKAIATRAKQNRNIFVMKGHGPGGHGPGGVFMRKDGRGGYVRLISFVETERFKPRFNYEKQVRRVAAAEFPKAMKRRLAEFSVKFHD